MAARIERSHGFYRGRCEMSATICEKDEHVALLCGLNVLRVKVLSVMEEFGSMCCNLRDAEEWGATSNPSPSVIENAKCSVDSVAAGAQEAMNVLLQIFHKCEEITGGAK